MSRRIAGGKSRGLEGVGGHARDAVAAFADQAIAVTLVDLEEVADPALGHLLNGDADGQDLFGAGRRAEPALGFDPGHQDAEVADQLEPRPAERAEQLVFRLFEEAEKVAEPDDAGRVGIGPVHANVDSVEIHRGTLEASANHVQTFAVPVPLALPDLRPPRLREQLLAGRAFDRRRGVDAGVHRELARRRLAVGALGREGGGAARRRSPASIGADRDEIAVLPSASAGINADRQRARLQRPALGRRDGRVRVPDDGAGLAGAGAARRDDPMGAGGTAIACRVSAYEAVVDERTLIVPTTHVCFRNGHKTDIAAVTGSATRAARTCCSTTTSGPARGRSTCTRSASISW